MRCGLWLAGAVLALTVQGAPPAAAQASGITQKLNAYIECTNRISGRAYQARERYLSWVGKSGPTGKEKIVYGTYTIYSTAECAKGVDAVAAVEPRDPPLEAAASAYVTAVVALEPLLKDADDYYTQKNYQDDKMAKGKAMHGKLLAGWAAFASADDTLRAGIDRVNDALAVEKLAAIERSEGRKGRYHIEALMMKAKRLVDIQGETPNELAKVTAALTDYEAIVKATEDFASANGRDSKIGSSFVSATKSFLTTSKALMRRVRDKVGYNQGEQMILRTGGGAWMVEGSPARLMHDYNQLVESYNRGASF